MNGLVWATGIWVAMFAVAYSQRARSATLRDWFSREHIALAVALVGTLSIASSSSAEEVLRQPLVLERIIRGGIAISALVIVLPLLRSRIIGYRHGFRAITGILCYLAVAAISTIYSAAPLVTAAKVGELTAGIAAIITIALGPDPSRRLRSAVALILAMMASLLACAVVGFFVLPSVFSSVQTRPGFLIRETLISPYIHSNSLSAHGAIIAVCCTSLALEAPRYRRLWSLGIFTGLAGIVLAAGRQGVAMFVAGIAVVLWAQRRGLFLTLLGPTGVLLIYSYWDTLFQSLSRNRPDTFFTLSGRLFWWEAAIEAWSVHPWTGWGYAAGGRFVALASIGSGRISNIHSGYLESLVGVGILGMIGFVYTLGAIVAWSFRTLRQETWLATLIVTLALRTAVSQGFGGWLNFEFVLFVLLAALADIARIERSDAAARQVRLTVG